MPRGVRLHFEGQVAHFNISSTSGYTGLHFLAGGFAFLVVGVDEIEVELFWVRSRISTSLVFHAAQGCTFLRMVSPFLQSA
jgi:hypothetical protein